jgi:antitoxin CcdA
VQQTAMTTILRERTTPPQPATRRATNLSLSVDVLEAAKALHINLSQTCDTYLRKVVREEQEQRWREEHAGFISAYNDLQEKEGLPLDEWRSF